MGMSKPRVTDPAHESIAGTHTTSATTTLLFYHLLHYPELMKKLVAEVDMKLPVLRKDEAAYPVTAVEASLPYLRNCMKENFRITPVFTMPLARRVMMPGGTTIAGKHIPHAVCTPFTQLEYHSEMITDYQECIDFNCSVQSCLPS